MAGTLLVFRTEYHLTCSDWLSRLSRVIDSPEFVMSKTVTITVILQRVIQCQVRTKKKKKTKKKSICSTELILEDNMST